MGTLSQNMKRKYRRDHNSKTLLFKNAFQNISWFGDIRVQKIAVLAP